MVEFTRDGRRLECRYSAAFRRGALVTVVLTSLAAVALLAYPVGVLVSETLQDRFSAGFDLIWVGGLLALWAVTGWLHLLARGMRPVVFDGNDRSCRIPMLFGTRLVRLGEVEAVGLGDGRGWWARWEIPFVVVPSLTSAEQVSLVLKGGGEVRLWGELGPTDANERMAEEVARFVGCEVRKAEGRSKK